MAETLLPYHSMMVACAVLACLIMVQVPVADVVSIATTSTPGMPVTEAHCSFDFRAGRAIGNTNETLGLFLLLAALAVVIGADAHWTNRLAWIYVAGRAGHMIFYYARLGL